MTVTPRSPLMPLISNPSYAPVVVTSVKIVHGAGTNVLVSEPPPGWAERQRKRLALRRKVSEFEERKDSEECGSFPPDLGNDRQSSEHPRPPLPAKSEPKVCRPFQIRPNWTDGGCLFQEYTFSKRKIYNTQFTKYWVVRHGEPLPSPPPEADASKCSGPAVFVNVPPEGGRQIWLWSADRRMWDAVSVRHNVDLDVRRQLILSPKHVPVFVLPRVSRGGGEEDGPRFIRYIAPSS